MSSGAVLTVVAMILALIIAGLFRLRAGLDSAELALRRLAGELRAAHKALDAAGELVATLERDADAGHAAFGRLEALKRPAAADEGGAGPVALPQRPAPAPRRPGPGDRGRRDAER